MNNENKITKSKNTLFVAFEKEEARPTELEYLIDNFCGQVLSSFIFLVKI